ncbi:MAG: efflux RND transporter periplasmic adaptor subunit [Gammaproteobacteria bacterium]|nr:efflux RND transporter periplasmic adaptor subunit [Gammaproteobacteria bacterium]
MTEQLTVTGSVVAPRVSRLSTEVAGWVAAMDVEVGDRVAAGAVLLRLDDELAAIALAAARVAMRAAAAELADARRRLAEAERLAAERTIPETELRARRAEVELDAATLEHREADARREQALLARHVLRAPFSGAVSRKLHNAGEWVEPGSAVLELVATDDLRIDFAVPQAWYGRIDAATAVAVRLDAEPGRVLRGRVVGRVPLSDATSRTFLLLTRIDADELTLIPGMSARATLELAAGGSAVVVPRDAVLRYPDGRITVWEVVRDGGEARVYERAVTLGPAAAGRIALSAGLAADAEVVVEGNERLREGQAVTPRAPP